MHFPMMTVKPAARASLRDRLDRVLDGISLATHRVSQLLAYRLRGDEPGLWLGLVVAFLMLFLYVLSGERVPRHL